MKTFRRSILYFLLLIPVCAFAQDQVEYGIAVYYADYFDGQETAYYETYDKYAMTCAHKVHPPGTLLRVTRLDNKRWVIVRVNDRGPFDEGRVVDLSWAAARELELVKDGMARVSVEVVGFSETNPPSKYAHLREQTPKTVPQAYSDDSGLPGYKGTGVKGHDATVTSLGTGIKGWSVQVASYTNEANAIRQVRALQSRDVPEVYMKITSGPQGQKMFKIVSGIFSTRPKAEAHVQVLNDAYQLSGFILKLD